MKRSFSIFAILVPLATAAVSGEAAQSDKGTSSFVRVAPDGNGFTLDGKPWRPMGCNYFDPHVGWAPKLWQKFDADRVEEHFRIMQDLGVNVVRVFLTAQSFFADPPNLDPDALGKFDTMLAIAQRHGIRVHPTGPDHWEGTPPWRRTDWIADPKALDVQVAFWKALAARYRDNPTIFAYDLLNEPHVRWTSPHMERQWREWLRKKYGSLDALRKAWGADGREIASFEGLSIPPDKAAPKSRRLLDYQHFRESVGARWVKLQVDAIRAADPNHPVTVGLIQWSVPVIIGKPSRYAAFRPSQIAPMVDFQSVHFYPLHGDPLASPENFDRNLAYLELVLRYVRAGAPRKPLVVGEFGWYGGGKPNDRSREASQEDQRRWCRAAVMQGRGVAAGWLNWPYADTPSPRDISKFTGLVTENGTPKLWGKAFRELATQPATWALPLDDPKATITFDVDRAIVDPPMGNDLLAKYFDRWKTAKRCGLDVVGTRR